MADPKLTIRIGADLAEIRRALAQVSTDLQTVRANAAKPANLSGLEKGAASALNAVKALAAGFAGIAGFQTFARIADQANTLTARLKLATSSQEEYTEAYEGTFEIAQRTRTSLESTVNLYARLERSTRDLGVSQAKLLQLTETINQAAQISGGGPGAEAALFQLSQGLASGILRGEELNSVLEQAPRIAQALADGLDLPIGKLREFAKEGKLTAEQVTKALSDQAKVIDAEYKKLPATISGAFTQLSNALTRFVGETDRAYGASQDIAAAIKTVADNLDKIAAVAFTAAKITAGYYLILKAGPAIYAALRAAADAYAAALARVAAATTLAGATTARVMAGLRIGAGLLFAAFTGWEIGTLLREQFLQVELFGIAMVNGLLSAWERLKQGGRLAVASLTFAWEKGVERIRILVAQLLEAGASASSAFGQDRTAAVFSDLAAKIRPAQTATDDFRKSVAAINAETAAAIALIDEETGALADYAIEARAAANAKTPRKTAEEETTGGTEGIGVGAANAAALVRDAIERALRELDRLYAEAEIDARAYFATKTNLELAAIDGAIAAAEAELKLAKTTAAQEEILTSIIKLQRDREEVAVAAARAQIAAEEELAKELAEVQTRINEAEGRTAAARIEALQREFADLRQRLEANGEAAGVALIDKLIDLEGAKARLEELDKVIQSGLSNLRSIESSVAAQVDAGLLTSTEGERQLQAVRAQTLAQLETYRAELQAVYETAKDPTVLLAIQQLDTELARIIATQRRVYNEIKEAGVDSLATAFSDIITGAETVEDAFRNMGRAFAEALAQIAAQELAKKAIDTISGLFGGGKASPAAQVAAGAAAGAAQAAALTPAAIAMTTAGTTIITGAAALTAAAAALQAAATTLIIANSIGGTVGVAHTGAIVGRGFPAYRTVPAWAFSGAPRYHSGGIAGLKPGEVPAILQTGEEVLSRDDPRNAANGGAGATADASGGVRIVNVLDPSMVSEAIASSSGEKAIMNVITRNSRGISQMLAR
jgi:tape measure domain-containing protein